MATTAPAPNLATCVVHVQFNIGDGFHQRELLADINGEKRVTLRADRELKGSLLVVFDSIAMSNLKVSETNLQLFLVDSNGKQEFGNVPEFPETRFHGFMTPELSLVFGEQRVFSLMYNTVFGTEEVLQITVACAKPSLDDLD
jgi:hypothetical protein